MNEPENNEVPRESADETSPLTTALNDILQRLAALEKKVDTLLAPPSRESSQGRPFVRDSRPRPFNRDSRPSFNRENRRDVPRIERPPRPPAPEIGVFIRTNLRGEHFGNKPNPGPA